MQSTPEREIRAVHWILAGAVLLNLVLLLAYIFITYQVGFNSDSAVKNLLASEIRRTGSMFPADFYNTRDLWIVQGHWIILLIAPLVGNGFLAHSVACAVMVGLLLYGFWRLLGWLGVSTTVRLGCLLLCSAGFSVEWAEHMYGQVSYGGACLLLLWAALANGAFLIDRRSGWPLALGAAFTCWLIGLNGASRGLVMFGLPVFVGAYVATGGGDRRRPVARFAWSLTALAIGLWMRFAISKGLLFIPATEIMRAASKATSLIDVSSVVGLFGMLPAERTPLTPMGAAINGLRFAIMLIVLVTTIAAARELPRLVSPRARFIIVAHLTLTVLVFYALFTVEELGGNPRYLIPAVFTGFAVAGVMLEARRAWVLKIKWMVPFGAAMVFLSWIGFIQPAVSAAGQRDWHHLSPFSRLIDELERRHFRYGYATFWNAGVVTVLSKGDVRIRSIELDRGVPVPFRHLSSKSWFGAEESGPTVLILQKSKQVAEFEGARSAGALRAPDDVVDVGEFRIYSYASNVFAHLSPWRKDDFETGAINDLKIEPRFLMSQPNVGKLVNEVLVAKQGESPPGFMAYGPMTQLVPLQLEFGLKLRPGRYEFQSDVALFETTGDAGAYWDISMGSGSKVLFKEPIAPGGRRTLSHVLEIGAEDPPPRIEARVYFNGDGVLYCFGTRMIRLR